MTTRRGKRRSTTPTHEPSDAERRERIRELVELLRQTIPPEKLKPLLARETTAWAVNRREKTLDEWATKWHQGTGYGPVPTLGDDGRVLGYSMIEVTRYIYNHTLQSRTTTPERMALMALANNDGEVFEWSCARGRLALLFGAAEILGLDPPEPEPD